MSQFSAEYQAFFTSPAGVSLLTWLQEQRTTEHERAEDEPTLAAYHSMKAYAYREISEHIDGIMTPMKHSPYSSKGSPKAPSAGLGTSQINER